jgi:probable HAF family extracellular repeat protein
MLVCRSCIVTAAGLLMLLSALRTQAASPPTVEIISPIDGAVSIITNDLVITVTAGDADGAVHKVALFRDGLFMAQSLTSPYIFRLVGLSAGTNVYTAVATDDSGETAESSPVRIFEQAPLPPYFPPTITLLTAGTNFTLTAPASFSLSAAATVFRDNFDRFDFQAVYEPFGSYALTAGEGRLNPSTLTLSNLAVGRYVFSVVARDIYGGTATSPSISVTILPPPVDVPTFRFTDLGEIAGTESSANGINAIGAVVGTSIVTDPYLERRAIRWQGGVAQEFPYAPAEDEGTAINDLGSVAGTLVLGGNPRGAFVWTSAGGFAEIPLSSVAGMNNLGQVVGWSAGSSPTTHWPAVWNPVGLAAQPAGTTLLSTNFLGQARAINAAGQIAGFLQDGNFTPARAVLWENGVVRELGMLAELGGLQSAALGLNDLGQVVGSVNLEVPALHGFLWENGTMKDLTPLIASRGSANDINNHGWIVGQSQNYASYPGIQHAVLWLDGVPFDLNLLATNLAGATLTTATAINDQGQIVGTASVGGMEHAYLLTPVTLVATNTPVSITLANPKAASSFRAGSAIPLLASVQAAGGAVARVDYYSGNSVIASATESPFAASWLPPSSGQFCIRAVAVDTIGYLTASAKACIEVDPAPPRYQLANIGELATTGRHPGGLNPAGHFVGQAQTETGKFGFIYAGGIITYLQDPAARAETAYGINDSDRVLVYNNSRAGVFHDGAIAFLTPFPAATKTSLGRAINAAGMVAGQSSTDSQETHAALFFGDSVTDIGATLGQSSQANAINDLGVAVGWYQSAPGKPTRMFVYDATNGLRTLDAALASLSALATGINNAGTIVGNLQNDAGYQNAFVYQNGVVLNLGTPSGQHSFAQGINNSNQVVGHIGTSYSSSRAFLAEGGPMVDLNSLLPATNTAILTEAVAINDKGQILADGFPTGADSDRRIFLLNPVPRLGQTNHSPTVSLQSPANEAVFYEGDDIPVLTSADDQDGGVSLVAFSAGTNNLGTAAAPPFGTVWSNVVAGTYRITATAFDNLGASNVSASVTVTVRAFNTNAPRVAILGAAPVDFSADIRQKLRRTQLFSKVDIIPMDASHPLTNLTQLNGYAAALVYSHLNANFPATVGDLLADYVDSGRGVVLALNAADSSKPHLPGRLTSQGYFPWTDTRLSPHGSETMLKDLPDHPILADVDSFAVGSAEYAEQTTLAPGAIQVASWDTQDPLVVAREIGGGRIVGLNLHPFSEEVSGFGWSTNSDGARLLANALTWAGGSQSSRLALATLGNTNRNNYLPGENIILSATGTNLLVGGTVQFYANGSLIAQSTHLPFSLSWTNPSVGNYLLTGVYSNATGQLIVSPGINVSVDSRLSIELVAPTNGSVVYLPTNILMHVALLDPDAAVTNVDYYIDGTQRIGSATTAPFSFDFTQFSIGTLKFSAVAKDALGSIRTSSVHQVTVIKNALSHLTQWTGGEGDWFTPTNWTAGTPRVQDSAEIKNGTAVIAAGSAVATNVTIGATNTAALVQAGSLNVGNELMLGNIAGSKGSYRLEAPGTLSVGLFRVGGFGSSTAVQNGGAVSAGQLIVGSSATGIYELTNGTLESRSEIVGLGTNGWFHQHGGVHTVTDSLEVGHSQHGLGVFQLFAGSLTASYEFIRGPGNPSGAISSFDQLGGVHRVVRELHLGDDGSAAELKISGGSLLADQFFMGGGGFLDLMADPTTNRFTVAGTAHLAGGLHVGLAPGYVPLGGDAITLMTYGGYVGTFAFTNLPPSANGVVWSLEYKSTALVLLALPPPQVVIVSPYSADPQTNLFHQVVTISNHCNQPTQGARIYFPGLPPGWEIYNSAGEQDGIPFVEIDSLIPPGSSVQFEVQFLIANETRPAKQNFAVLLGDVAGVGTPERPIQVDQIAIRSDGTVSTLLATGRNRLYVVQYSDDLVHWASVPQPIVAAGSRTQWVDDGPPKTSALPLTRSARYYRILEVTKPPPAIQTE